MTLRNMSVLAVVFLLGLTAGCRRNSNAPADITGKVTKNGVPVGAGRISFKFADGTTFSVALRKDGVYEAYELMDGEAVVTIDTESANPDKKPPEYKGGDGSSNDRMNKAYGGGQKKTKIDVMPEPSPRRQNPDAGTYVHINEKYADANLSNLKVKIKRGKNTANFEVTD